MDLGPGYLLVALFVGLAGMGLLMYGKKAADFRALMAGGILSAEAVFLHSAAGLLVGAAATGLGFYLLRKFMPA